MSITADTLFGIPVHVTRNVEIGKPIVANATPIEALFGLGGPAGPPSPQSVFVHPLDHWRLRHPESTGLSHLEVLARWHVEEVDRRLTAAGYPPETVPEKVTIDRLDVGTITATRITAQITCRLCGGVGGPSCPMCGGKGWT